MRVAAEARQVLFQVASGRLNTNLLQLSAGSHRQRHPRRDRRLDHGPAGHPRKGVEGARCAETADLTWRDHDDEPARPATDVAAYPPPNWGQCKGDKPWNQWTTFAKSS